MLKADADTEEYKYTCEPGHAEWTPMNSNLHMQGIKVLVHKPIPEKTINNLSDSHEDTLLLLDLIKQKKAKEGQQKKDAMIRAMALQQKEKRQQQQQDSYCKLSWNSKTAARTTGGL